ncbi:ribose-phosphate diphosphokinase [Halovenus halobia]|uniref:ribose-phosphate diphosphokinase n=1 Tax=Halovenus halobia TaxID=3396622 RepID=UPI003F57CAF8
MIVAGSATQGLAAELAAETGRALTPVSYEQFPDGERKVQVTATGDRAVVVASTISDGDWVELLQLQDALAEAGVEHVTTVLPYMGYARQDQAFEDGDPVSARAMARAISTGTDRVITVNPHEEAVTEFFDVPTTTLDAAGRLATPLDELTDPLFLSPDAGAIELAETVRDAYGRGAVDHFEKTRHSGTDVEIEPSEAAVDGRDVVLVDDIVATGSTMSESVAVLNAREANNVIVTCVHPLLVSNARLKLARAGVETVYGTDTIERGVSEVSVAPAVADVL